MKHIILGTAGHVDHGKTALIKALTGTDTDRLKEEKLRGISIDLGFASLRLSDDLTMGIVDVPGHERFLKNMLAGTGGIDMVLLVIAADEGIMPQTREHLAMLELLGIRSGIVVITKIDKADEDWLELVEDEVRQLLVPTFLADAPIVRVSAVTGDGLEKLKQELLTIGGNLTARDSTAPFRLWIDRVFTIKGYGTVVTGSVLSGSTTVGESLLLYPAGEMLRVRGLESHGSKVDSVYAGQRAAINIGGSDADAVERGMVLSAPRRGLVSSNWDMIADWSQEIASGTRVRLHLGTGEFLGRIYRFKDQPLRYARIILEAPLTAGLGDRAIIRRYSPQELLGGGTLIAPGRQSRRLTEARRQLAIALESPNLREILLRLIADNSQPVLLEEIKSQMGYVRDAAVEEGLNALLADTRIQLEGSYYLTREMFLDWTRSLTGAVSQYHRENPDRAGLSKEILRQKLGLKDKAFAVLLESWQKQGVVVLRGAEVALREFAARHSDWRQDVLEKVDSLMEDIGLESVTVQLLAEKMRLSPEKARAAQEILIQSGLLVRVGEMHVYRKTIQNITRLIQGHFTKNPTLTVAQLRDLLGTSRKVALPLLEYFDAHKYTVRDGDIRRAGLKMEDLSE